MVQDGRVEEPAFTSSFESTKITTSCSTTIDKRTLEPIKKKKKKPTSKDKGEAAIRQKEGHNHNKMISHIAKWATHKRRTAVINEVVPLL